MNKLTLFPQQERAADVLVSALERYGAALDSSDTGTGKTVKAVEVSRMWGVESLLVICPKVVIGAWEETFKAQGVPYSQVINYEKLRTGNHGWVMKRNKKFAWTQKPHLIIWDEVQRCKGRGTLNSNMLVSAVDAGIPCLMLSATAAENPTEMQALGYALGLHDHKHFYPWAKKWGSYINEWNQLVFPDPDRDGLKLLKQLKAYIYPDRGHKIHRADVAEHFSETSIVTESIIFGSEKQMQRIYSEMEAELERLTERAEEDSGASHLTTILRARQQVEILKIPEFVSMTQDLLDDGKSVAIFVNFQGTMESLVNKISVPVERIHGGQTDKARKAAIDRFQSGESRVIVVNIQAGGVALSLHDTDGGYPRVALISPTWSAKDLIQVLGRVDRAGSKSPTVQRIMVARGTIEEDVADAAKDKIINLETLHGRKKVNQVKEPEQKEEAGVEEHAEYNPSSQKLRKVCPHYRNREDGDTNPAAEMGTRIHMAVETDDLSVCKNDYEKDMASRLIIKRDELILKYNIVFPEHERRFHIDFGGPPKDTFGTCDFFGLTADKKTALAIDYKTGKTPVDDAEVNDQGELYNLGAFQEEEQLEEIHFYFLIPAQNEISYAKFTREKDYGRLYVKHKTIIERAEAAKDGTLEEYNPQPDVCDFCGNAANCKAWTNRIINLASKYVEEWEPLPNGKTVHATDIDDPYVLAMGLRAIPVIEQWIKGWRRKCQQIAEEGVDIPGFKLSYVKSRSSITNLLSAVDVLKNYGATENDIFAFAKLGITDAKNLVRENAPPRKKQLTEDQFMNELEEKELLAGGEDTPRLSPIRGTKPKK